MAIDRIARIQLRGGVPGPRGAAVNTIVLIDGTVRYGVFAGLDRAFVRTDAGDIARDNVALIILVSTEPTASATMPRDVLILTDASHRLGRLRSCNLATCLFDGERIEVDRLRWIGLRQEDAAPPSAADLAELLIVDGQPVDGRMSAIYATAVTTTRGRFPRDHVSWIHLGPKAQSNHPSTLAGTESQNDQQPPPAPQPNVNPPQPGPKPLPTPAPATGDAGTRGALWTGTIKVRAWGTMNATSYEGETNIAARLREYVVPMRTSRAGNVIGAVTYLVSEGSAIDTKIHCRGRESCSGEGRITATANPADAHDASAIYQKTKEGSTSPLLGIELPVGAALYHAIITAPRDARFDVTYRNGADKSVSPSGFLTALLGRAPKGRALPMSDPQLRYVNNGKMIGSYTVPAIGIYEHVAVAWAICREGVECPRAELQNVPPKKTDPCGSTATARGLLDTVWNQRQLKARELEKDWNELKETNQKLVDNLPAWRAAIPICAIEEIGATIGEAFVITAGGEAAEFTSAVAKMVTGDLTFVFQNELEAEGNALENGLKLGGAGKGFADPKAMEEALSDCLALPADLKRAARDFVDAYAEVPGLMRRVKTDINDIRSKDQQYWDQWQAYYRACVERAQCEGTSPAACPAPPSPPSGPMPGQTTSEPTGPPR